jgi:hypothetical protein
MKTLREYDTLTKGQAGTDTDHGVAWGPAFPTPIHGTVNGLPVRAIAIGDLPGASDVLLCSDPTGFLQQVRRIDFVTTDGAYLPLHAETTPLVGSMR